MAVALAGFAAIFSGSGDFLGGLASRHGNVAAVAIWSNAWGVPAALVLSPLVGGSSSGADLAWGALAGTSGGLAILALYAGFARSDVAIVSPIAAVGAAGWPVLFALATGERPSGLQAVGLVLGLVAIWMVSGGSLGRSSARGFRFGMLAGLGFGGLLVFLSRVSEDSGIWPLIPARLGGVAILVAIAVATGGPRRPASSMRPIAAAGAATILGNGAFILATQHGPLAVVSVVAAMFPATTVLLARAFFNERLSVQRATGLAMALTAVGLVAAG